MLNLLFTKARKYPPLNISYLMVDTLSLHKNLKFRFMLLCLIPVSDLALKIRILQMFLLLDPFEDSYNTL